METKKDLNFANKVKAMDAKISESEEEKLEAVDSIKEAQTEEIGEMLTKIDLNDQNKNADEEEETCGCCCWKFNTKKPKSFRRGTIKLANRLRRRKSKKKSESDEQEVVAEEKNDLSAATIAALCGR